MGMGGGMARVVVRYRVLGFRDCGSLSLGQSRVFAGSRHGWCFTGLGLEVLVLISALVGIGTD